MIVYRGCLKPKVCKCSLWRKGGSDSHHTFAADLSAAHVWCEPPILSHPKGALPLECSGLARCRFLKKNKTAWRVLHFVIRCTDLLVVFIRRCLSCCGLKVTTTLRLAVVFNKFQVVPGVPRKYIPTAGRWLSASNGWLAIWVSEQLTGYRCT